MKIKKLLDVEDELNLYLVANKLKPASTIYIDPRSSKLEGKVVLGEDFRDKIRYDTFKLNSNDIENFRETLFRLGIKYKDWEDESVNDSWDSKGNQRNGIIRKGQKFYIGYNEENLERLLLAKEAKDFGRALGFPEKAVKSHQKMIDGERRDGGYVPVSLARAKKAGLKLPTWLGYISFIPENLDLVKGNVSPTSELLAKKYQNFVREHNSELAGRVEQAFLSKKLPESWEQMPHGGYSLTYKFQPNQK